MKLKCPTHLAHKLVPSKTKYGIRWACPVPGCTVVCWDGSSSTPANLETRQARIAAHEAFNQLWESGMFSKGVAYKRLSEYLGLPQNKTHIGHFDIKMCHKVIAFSHAILME